MQGYTTMAGCGRSCSTTLLVLSPRASSFAREAGIYQQDERKGFRRQK
jgi:hypothetical protein